MIGFFTARNLLLSPFLSTAVYVQLRGRVRHKFSRLIADHANLMAPYNTLIYMFAAVPAKPFADVRQFPELAPITAQWQMIRDEALKLSCSSGCSSVLSCTPFSFEPRWDWSVWVSLWIGRS